MGNTQTSHTSETPEESVDKEPNSFECPVCAETFTSPKILKCGHLLCRNCIVNWLKTQLTAGCPLCRSKILDEGELRGRRMEEVVDGFPTDLAITALAEAEVEVAKKHVCCRCWFRVPAVARCLQCGDTFCRHCSVAHKTQASTMHHDLRELSYLTAEKLAYHKHTTCPQHKDKVCHKYCLTHSVPFCELCATASHKECPQVVSLQTKVAQLAEELHQLKAQLGDGQEANLRLLNKRVEDVKSQAQIAEDRMENVRERLKAAVDARFREVKDTIDKVVAEETDFKAWPDTVRKRIKMSAQNRKSQEHENVHDIFSLAESRAYDLELTMPKRVKVNHKLTLHVDLEEVALFEEELTQLGYVRGGTSKEKTDEENNPPPPLRSSPQQRTPAGPPVLRFHDNHGCAVELRDDGQTARRARAGRGNGVVISRDPMEVDTLYQVRVDRVNGRFDHTQLGVLATSPDQFTLPYEPFHSGADVVLLQSWGEVVEFGRRREDRRLEQLNYILEGATVGLCLDSGVDRRLELYLDGRNLGVVVASKLPDPCYFFFDLFSRCRQVSALPVKRFEKIPVRASSGRSCAII